MRPLNEQKTAPFILGTSERACLLIHGFTGSPWDMKPLGEALAKRGYFVEGIRLRGHGQEPQAMLGVRYSDWLEETETALKRLSESHRPVFVVGLSMGALLAILLAARFPSSVQAVVLLAPAARLRARTAELVRLTRRFRWIPPLLPWLNKTGTDIGDPNELAAAPIIPRFPTSLLYDLWSLQDLAQKEACRVTAPTLVIVARKDRVVSNRAARALARSLVNSRAVEFVELSTGRHIIPRDYAREMAAEKIATFLAQW